MKTSEAIALIEKDPPPILAKIRALRPYKIPKGFLPWRSLSALIAVAVAARNLPVRDASQRTVFYRLILWLIQDAPLYCISQELLEAFAQTDILDKKSLLQGLETPVPTFIILLPPDALKTPVGDTVEYMIIHKSDRSHPERSMGKSSEFGIDLQRLRHDAESVIHCGASDAIGTVWFGGIGLNEDGSLTFDADIPDAHDPDDKMFINLLRSISLQAILALQYQPELLSDGQPQARPKGFKKLQESEIKYRLPRWIGKDFKPKQGTPIQTGTGTHASPRTHWRRGHLRRVAIGEGRSDRKIIWVQPVLVNSA